MTHRSTLAVFAHFDPGGQVAPHVRRYLAALTDAVDRVVVVSAAQLTDSSREVLRGYGELVERENVGYDFYSWKTGLDHAGDWDAFDRVLICNDSVVGPMRPFSEILGDGAPEDADFWGMTASNEISPHVQSWFVVFERPVITSGLLHAFWRAMEPVSNRYVVIRRYEVGLSKLLLTGGLRMGSYLRLTPRNAIRAELRHRTALERLPAKQRPERPGFLTSLREPTWNATYVLWDAVFDGRLPFVKLEVLRDDPYEIGKEKALARLEEAFPAELAGVREYLDRTREEFRLLRGLEPVDPVRGIQAPVLASAVEAEAATDGDGTADDGEGPGADLSDDGRPVDGGENVADQLAVSR
jgi:hypothetical protein